MNFIRGLVKKMGAQLAVPECREMKKDPSSNHFEVISIDIEQQNNNNSSPLQIQRDPTQYYMIQNQFFNNIIVQKDQKLKILSLEEWRAVIKNKSLEKICQKNLIFSIMKGIPKQIRKQFWEILADTEKMKGKFQINYYQVLEKKNTRNKDIIIKDVPRTKVDQRHREKLENVLCAYSCIDPMGYTQGMNLICGSLLNILSSQENNQLDPEIESEEIGFEEKVFWVFMGIMYGKNWREIFQEMKGVKRMLGELENLMEKHTPQILWHIKELELDLNMCFAQYYLTLVIYNTPIEFATIILDLFLLEGQRVIHSIILKMLIACRERILQIDDMGILIRFFKSDMLEYCHVQTKKQCQSAQNLQDFIINFFTLSSG